MTEAANAINVYTCDTCGGRIVTKNLVEGTTPFSLSCLATTNCRGTMYSCIYQCDQTLAPTHEWFLHDITKAGVRKRLGRVPGMIEHVEQGGLDLRPVVH